VQGEEGPPLQLPHEDGNPEPADTKRGYDVQPVEVEPDGMEGWHYEPEQIDQVHTHDRQRHGGKAWHSPLDTT
jgi:hypothetical protein